MTVLVTGARGQIGSAVLAELVAAGQPVRASSRNPRPGEFPAEVEVFQADLSDPTTFPALLDGVRKIFLYANADAAVAFAEQARQAGVEHVVLLSSNSVVFPGAEQNPIARMHLVVERALVDAGLDWTFVRPGYLATNTLRWTSIRTERVLRTTYPESVTPLVHERDVAEVAVRALLDDDLRGTAPLVLGDGPLTVRDQVGVIADALGEPVRVDVVDEPTYRAELLTQLPEPFVDLFLAMRGNVYQVPAELGRDATAELLGRPVLSYRAWAGEHADEFR